MFLLIYSYTFLIIVLITTGFAIALILNLIKIYPEEAAICRVYYCLSIRNMQSL